MKIYIELLVIFALMMLFILWRLWFSFTNWRLKKKYNPEEDLGKSAEQFRKLIKQEIINDGRKTEEGGENLRASAGREPVIDGSDESIIRPTESEGPKLLQTTTSNNVGKTINGNRKNVTGFRKLLKRTRRN